MKAIMTYQEWQSLPISVKSWENDGRYITVDAGEQTFMLLVEIEGEGAHYNVERAALGGAA